MGSSILREIYKEYYENSSLIGKAPTFLSGFPVQSRAVPFLFAREIYTPLYEETITF